MLRTQREANRRSFSDSQRSDKQVGFPGMRIPRWPFPTEPNPWTNMHNPGTTAAVQSGVGAELEAHLAEVHGAVFPADVLLALAVGRLRLRGDRLACRGGKSATPSSPLSFQCLVLKKQKKKTTAIATAEALLLALCLMVVDEVGGGTIEHLVFRAGHYTDDLGPGRPAPDALM